MRTGGNADDAALLEGMGEKSSDFRSEKLRDQKHLENLTLLAEENANALKQSKEVSAALKAKNSRAVAFNARINELTSRGFSVDQAILQMRANSNDAALLAEMSAPR